MASSSRAQSLSPSLQHPVNEMVSSSSDHHPMLLPHSESNRDIPTETPRLKRRRGKAKAIRLQFLTEKIKIVCNESFQPCKENAKTLQNYIGILARDNKLCPQNFKNWHEVHDYYKDKIFDMVESKFDFQVGEEEMKKEDAKKTVLKALGKKWRDHRCSLKEEHFDENLSKDQNISKLPSYLDKAEWIFLVEYFMGDGVELHKIGKKNRESQTLVHHTGRKSFARMLDDYINTHGKMPGPLEMFEATHLIKSTGKLNEEASILVETVQRKVIELQEASNDPRCDSIDLQRQAFVEILGPEHPGHVRFFGQGAKKSIIYGSSKTPCAINSEVVALRREVEELKGLREENAILKQSHQQMLERLDRCEKFMTHLQANSRDAPSK